MLFAYDLTADTPARDSSRDIPLADDNRNPVGVHAIDGILWVGDKGVEKIFAYDLATGARLADMDIDVSSDVRPLSDASHIGMWTDGTTMWTADPNSAKLYAWDVASKARKPTFDIVPYGANRVPDGIVSYGTTMLVADHLDCTIYRYALPQ